MAPPWLTDISRSFKRHRMGRPGWFLELHRDKLRVCSAELPRRPGEAPSDRPVKRSFTLSSEPGPRTASAALVEACELFDAVLAGTWRWPTADDLPASGDPGRLSGEVIRSLIERLRSKAVGEKMAERTWTHNWQSGMEALAALADQQLWPNDESLLRAFLQRWEAGSRCRQIGYGQARRLWTEAGWEWPQAIEPMRGNGRAAAAPEGVRAFTDQEISQLRARILSSHQMKPSAQVAWDLLIAFGLRPVELQAIELQRASNGALIAVISRSKVTSSGTAGGARQVPAVPPADWPPDCHKLFDRWQQHGLPSGLLRARSPGDQLSSQLRRMQFEGLTPYGLRHAFALRLGIELGLSVRESAQLMGHTPQVHLNAYGRRIDQPALQSKVLGLTRQRAAAAT
jgi:integrase